MKPNLLVTGASGFLGWNLCQQAAAEWEVYGTYLSHAIAIPHVSTVAVDLRDLEAIKSLFIQIAPAAVIHTAALSSPNVCQKYPDESYAINVRASLNLAQASADLGIPFVFTSTDLVFDGNNAPYQEGDRVSPLNLYGEQKAIAEQKILEAYPNAGVCRLPLMFGAAPPNASSFIQPFIKQLREGQELRLFADEFRTPVSAATASQGLLLALKHQGLLHLGGKERLSRYQFGQLMVAVLQVPGATLTSCLQKEVPMAASRPKDVSLNSAKAYALGYQPPSLREELVSLRGKV